jgi:hypothetical protein
MKEGPGEGPTSSRVAPDPPEAYPPPVVRFFVVVALAVLVLQPACIFFVPDTGPLESTACHFKGQTVTACGVCVASKCQGAVNACCTDSTCQGSLDDLDTCAGSDAGYAGCLSLTMGDPTFNSSASLNSLVACMEEACAPDCAGVPDGGSPDAPFVMSNEVISCMSSGPSACSCDVYMEAAPNTVECDPGAFGNGGICCAQPGYPALAKVCECVPYLCAMDNMGDCDCSTNPEDLSALGFPTSECDDGSGGVCCLLSDGLCQCTTSEVTCPEGTMVDMCYLPPMTGGCPAGTSSAPSCSTP